MPDFSGLTAAAASRLLDKSPIALRGRVVELAAATRGIPADDGTAVLSVEEVLAAPPGFPNVAGRDVTVRLKGRARRGEHAVFLVESWIYSATVGMREVARVGGIRSTDAVRNLFVDAAASRGQRIFRARVLGADIVVAGVVDEARHAANRGEGLDDMHAPGWAEAVVTVEETLKGRPARPLVVSFPTSSDDVWLDCPRLRPGLRAMFLLRRAQKEHEVPGLSGRDVTALDPMDVQPVETVDDVRKVIGKRR